MAPTKSSRNYILILLGILLLMVIATGIYGIMSIEKMKQEVKSMYSQELVTMEILDDVKSSKYRIRGDLLELILSKSVHTSDRLTVEIREQKLRIEKQLAEYKKTRISEEEQRLLQNFSSSWNDYIHLVESEILPLSSKGEKEKAADLARHDSVEKFREAREAMNSLMDYHVQRGYTRYYDIHKMYYKVLWSVFITFLVIIVLTTWTGWLLIRRRDIQLFEFMAYHDPLTGLFNRMKLFHFFNEHLLKSSKNQNLNMAVIFIDLDGFKEVNDNMGHQAGDLLLQIIAKRIKNVVRQDDIAARLGGDEFVVIAPTLSDRGEITLLAQKIVNHISHPYIISNEKIEVTASIGVSIYPQDGREAEVLIQKADQAMYKAKKKGKNQVCYD
jgi:diguanylate cyclase (GGDEF)-like protein